MKIFAETTVNEYKHPTRISSNIQAQILGITNNKGKTIGEVIAELEKRNQEKLTQFPATSDEKTKRMIQILNRKEILNWLTNLPIKEHGYELTKQEFWDAIKIRYNWPLGRIPSQCFCGESFNVTHALSCKKGGFVTLRHKEERDITSELLDGVCIDVRKDPILQEVNNGDRPGEVKKSKETRLDINALNFWMTGQRAFFDVRVLNLFAQRHSKMAVDKCFRANENEKKRNYRNRELQIENGSFTPLVFASNCSMGK